MSEPLPSPAMLLGKCGCGAVAYHVEDAFEYAINCHCSACRQATGAAFKPIAGIKRAQLRLVAGEDAVLIVGESAGDHDVRCRQCGSFLYSVVRAGEYVHVGMGSLVDEPSIRPQAHIFVGSKAKWFEITDDLPQFKEFPGG